MYVDITSASGQSRPRGGEARYRLLAENTTDLIWTMNLGLKYTT
jgi:hypothetical protein